MCKVKFETFANEFAKDLEIEGNEYLTCRLKDLPEYDSMGLITVSLTIERLYDFQIPLEALDDLENLKTLYIYCEDFSV